MLIFSLHMNTSTRTNVLTVIQLVDNPSPSILLLLFLYYYIVLYGVEEFYYLYIELNIPVAAWMHSRTSRCKHGCLFLVGATSGPWATTEQRAVLWCPSPVDRVPRTSGWVVCGKGGWSCRFNCFYCPRSIRDTSYTRLVVISYFEILMAAKTSRVMYYIISMLFIVAYF